jgi:hypothetical protein
MPGHFIASGVLHATRPDSTDSGVNRRRFSCLQDERQRLSRCVPSEVELSVAEVNAISAEAA